MIHRVPLNNGQVLLVEEDDGKLSLAQEEPGCPGKPGYWICQVNNDGVLVLTSCGDAPARLTEGLKRGEDGEEAQG